MALAGCSSSARVDPTSKVDQFFVESVKRGTYGPSIAIRDSWGQEVATAWSIVESSNDSNDCTLRTVWSTGGNIPAP